MEEQVGYEEYAWEEDEMGFTLTVRGRITKPIAITIERLVIRVNKSFIPERYQFYGQLSGVDQDIQSFFSGGKVVTTKKVAGQERTETVDVRRDTLLLPNPVFSPFMVLAKKFRCDLRERIEISAYIIPQMEISAFLEPSQDSPCHLMMEWGPTQIEIKTDEKGSLLEMEIPSQNLKVLRTQVDTAIR